ADTRSGQAPLAPVGHDGRVLKPQLGCSSCRNSPLSRSRETHASKTCLDLFFRRDRISKDAEQAALVRACREKATACSVGQVKLHENRRISRIELEALKERMA